MYLTFAHPDGKPVVIEIIGKSLRFCAIEGGYWKYAPIEGLKLNPATIVQEFPDLEGKPIDEIKKEAIKRFKEKLSNFDTKEQIKDYLEQDLRPHGYRLIMYQRKGCRPVPVKT